MVMKVKSNWIKIVQSSRMVIHPDRYKGCLPLVPLRLDKCRVKVETYVLPGQRHPKGAYVGLESSPYAVIKRLSCSFGHMCPGK